MVKADVSYKTERRWDQTMKALNARLGHFEPCFLFPRLLKRGPGLRALPTHSLRQSQAASVLQGQEHFSGLLFSAPAGAGVVRKGRHLQFRSGADGRTSLMEAWGMGGTSCLASHTHPDLRLALSGHCLSQHHPPSVLHLTLL